MWTLAAIVVGYVASMGYAYEIGRERGVHKDNLPVVVTIAPLYILWNAGRTMRDRKSAFRKLK